MKRILTAIVMIALVVLLLFKGQPWMVTLAAAVVALLASIEFQSLASASKAPIPVWWIVLAVAAFFFAVFERPQDTIAIVALLTLILFTVNAITTSVERVLGETAAGLLMLVYVAFPLTLIPQIFQLENGTALVLFLFLCVWCGDIAALYVGKRFGKHKLAPRLSPNKTWEGSIASVAAAILFGLGLIFLGSWLATQSWGTTRLHTSAPWWQWLLLAIGLNAAAQFGDLLESAIKRGANVKDSGTMLPGHGGMLDRIDALLLAAPVLWFIVVLRESFSLGSF